MRNRIRTHMGTVVLATCVLVAGVRGDTVSPPTRVLHFPKDGYCTGSLYVEDPCLGSEYRELGRDLSLPYGLNPRQVGLGGDWDFVGLAQGDVAMPAGRNIKLQVMLRLSRDRNKLAALPPRQLKMVGMDRCREDPLDLSGLSTLGPDDLYCLHVGSLVPRADADQCVLQAIRHLTGLKILELYKTGVTDKGLETLRELRSLGALEIVSEPFIGNQGLVVLKDLPNLEYLGLDINATDAGLKSIGQSRSLRWLRISTGRIWGPGLAELANLPRLERLCISGDTALSDRHIQYLEGLTRLKSLTLWAVADGLTDASLMSISKLKSLEELYFIRTMPRFTSAGIAHLKNLKNLKKLEFAQTWCGPQGVSYGDEVARQLADMSQLEAIRGMAYLSAEGMEALATLPNLKCLDVALRDRRQGYDGPIGLSALSRMKALEELRFSGGKSLSDADLVQLESLGSLRNLFIGFSETTDRGMASLGKLHRLERLAIGGDCSVTKRGLNELKGLTSLQTFDISAFHRDESTIDEVPLNFSTLKNLKTLELQGIALQDADLASLAGMGDLEWLILEGSFTENALPYLKDLHSLKFMRIRNVSCLSGGGVYSLAGLPKLTDLGLDGQITDGALGCLAGFPSLWSLTIKTNEPVRPATKDHLRQALPTVEYVHIDPLPRFGPPELRTRMRSPRPVRPGPPRTSRPTRPNSRRSR